MTMSLPELISIPLDNARLHAWFRNEIDETNLVQRVRALVFEVQSLRAANYYSSEQIGALKRELLEERVKAEVRGSLIGCKHDEE